MRQNGTTAGMLARIAMLVVALVFAGCATNLPDLAPVEPELEPVVVAEPVTPKADSEPEPPVKAATPPNAPPIAIVLTSSQPAYLDVAAELADQFENHSVYDLSSESLPPVAILNSINDSKSTTVVAIGLRAAQSAVAISNAPVVFSQVFNHQDHNLLTDNSRGVASLAPLDAQLAAWKKVDPAISKIGLIIGVGHDDLISDAEIAAARHDIELRIRVAHSDQETLYFFRRMIQDIDGFWLFPDNRILSARVLSDMLDDANRQHVQVAVPNESMLQMGAALSISTVAADIAATIAKVVRRIQAGEIDQIPPMTELSEVRVATNDELLIEDTVANTSEQQ